MKPIYKFFIALALPLLVGAISGYLTVSNVNGWYTTINKPSFNPPNQVFGPVWSVLYIMMGVAFYLVWKSKPDDAQKRKAIILFAVQLILNFFWSFIFFYLHQTGLAFGEIILLWLCIAATIAAFYTISKPAAWLLVPYILWVSFATVLTYSIWKLN